MEIPQKTEGLGRGPYHLEGWDLMEWLTMSQKSDLSNPPNSLQIQKV